LSAVPASALVVPPLPGSGTPPLPPDEFVPPDAALPSK
jgi:hypothetical protein